MKRARAVIAALCITLCFFVCGMQAKADTEIAPEIRDGVRDALDRAGVGAWEDVFSGLPEDVRALWGGAGLEELIGDYALGQGVFLGNTLQSGLTSLVKSVLPSMLPLLIALLAVAVITGFLRAMHDAGAAGLNDVAGFVCQCFAIVIALTGFISFASLATACIDQTTAFIELAFPVLTTLLTAAGGIVSSGIFQPAMAMLCSGVSVILQKVVVPVILVGGAMGVLNNITGRVQLGQLFNLSKTVAKWLIGLLFTLYFAITSLQGMAASAFDGVSIRTAKFAIDKLVPIVGGMVSGTVDTVLGCALLAKNAVGMAAIIISFAIVCMPLIQIAAGMLAFRLAAALCEPIGDPRLPKMLAALADVLTYLFAAAMSLSVMFIITVGLIMGTGGIAFAGG